MDNEKSSLETLFFLFPRSRKGNSWRQAARARLLGVAASHVTTADRDRMSKRESHVLFVREFRRSDATSREVTRCGKTSFRLVR